MYNAIPMADWETMKLFKKYVFFILEVLENGISIVCGILSFLINFFLNQKRQPEFPKEKSWKLFFQGHKFLKENIGKYII